MITLMTTLWKWLLQIVDQFYKGAASPGVDLLMEMMILIADDDAYADAYADAGNAVKV